MEGVLNPQIWPVPENVPLVGQHASKGLAWVVIKGHPHLVQPLTCAVCSL